VGVAPVVEPKYDGLLVRLLVLIVVVACSKSEDKKPAASDPWATPSPGSDPWAPATAEPEHAKPTPAPPEDPAPQAPPAGGATLAGTYQCQTLRYGTLVNGMYQTAYVASSLGTFEIDADGAYRSASYPDKGSGRTSAAASTITFEDGPYAGFIGEIGSNSSGAYIHFGAKPSDAPVASMHFNDHVCYRH
jgi:hypothetical protein